MNRGLLYAIGSTILFSVMDVMVKQLSTIMDSSEIVFGRSAIGIIVLLIIMKSGGIKFSHKDFPALVFRGAVGGMSMYLLFLSISGMRLGDVAILQQLSAIFVLLLSALWLKQKLPGKTYPPLLVIIFGAALVLRPWEYSSFSGYAVFMIMSAFLSAVAYITISKLFESGGHNSWEIVFYFLFCSMLIGGVGMTGHFTYPNVNESILLIGIGTVSLLAQALMTQSYGCANAVLVSFVFYLEVFFNVLWGYFLFNEAMYGLSIAGGVLVIGGSVYLTIMKNADKKQRQTLKK